MRSNRGLSEFASFPLLLILALVIIIVSVLMYAAEFSNETSSIDSGIQAATVALLHAERDQVEAYLRTALDRSVRDGIARAYAYRSLACPISEQGLPIISDSCGYGYDAFVSSTERFATNRFSQVVSDHPSAVLMDAQVTIDDRSRGEIGSALVFHETGSGSRIYEISRDIESRELPIFLGSLEAFDHIPETITSEPELDFDSDTPPYCADDPMNKEKAATFVRNTIEYCERQTGTCSCGSVPLPEGERNKLEVSNGEVTLHEYTLGIREDELEKTFWIDRVATDRLFIHRNDSGVILNATDPGLPTCTGTVRTVAIGSADPLPVDLSRSGIVRAPPVRIDRSTSNVDLEFPEVDLYVYLASHGGDRIEYGGDADLSRLIDRSLRVDDSIFGFEEQTQGIGFISCVASPYLFDASIAPAFDLDQTGIKTIVESLGSDSEVLFIRYPERTALDCGSQPVEGERYGTLLQTLVQAIEHAVRVTANPPRTRLVCIDDPIEEWVEIDGEQQYVKVYPTIAVPSQTDAIWPLEDVGMLTQCWGPPAQSWLDAPYAFHRGVDLQPTGARADRVMVDSFIDPGGLEISVFDRFTDVSVVSVDDGTIISAWICPFPVEEGLSIEMGSASSEEERRLAAQEFCRGRDTAAYLGASSGGLGEHIVIDHGDFRAIYGHFAPGTLYQALREQDVIEEDLTYEEAILFLNRRDQSDRIGISQGTRLGLVGNTGTSFGAHLHFETYRNEGSLINEANGRTLAPPGNPYRYTPATDFVQFSPFCVLPKELETASGSFDISTRMPIRADLNPASSSVDDVDLRNVRSGEEFVRPATLADQCSYNYLMAYFNHNPAPDTYGVCPVI